MESESSIQTSIAEIDLAISALVSGKRYTKLEIGSGTSKKVWEYHEITLEALREYRAELVTKLTAIQAAQGTATVSFSGTNTILAPRYKF